MVLSAFFYFLVWYKRWNFKLILSLIKNMLCSMCWYCIASDGGNWFPININLTIRQVISIFSLIYHILNLNIFIPHHTHGNLLILKFKVVIFNGKLIIVRIIYRLWPTPLFISLILVPFQRVLSLLLNRVFLFSLFHLFLFKCKIKYWIKYKSMLFLMTD